MAEPWMWTSPWTPEHRLQRTHGRIFLSALLFAAHQKKITGQAQAEIADQGIPHQWHQGAAEQCRRWSTAGAAKPSIALDEVLNLFRVLQEEADG